MDWSLKKVKILLWVTPSLVQHWLFLQKTCPKCSLVILMNYCITNWSIFKYSQLQTIPKFVQMENNLHLSPPPNFQVKDGEILLYHKTKSLSQIPQISFIWTSPLLKGTDENQNQIKSRGKKKNSFKGERKRAHIWKSCILSGGKERAVSRNLQAARYRHSSLGWISSPQPLALLVLLLLLGWNLKKKKQFPWKLQSSQGFSVSTKGMLTFTQRSSCMSILILFLLCRSKII